MLIPFGAKILFLNNPDRALSPTPRSARFRVERGLVTKLEAIDYHLEHGRRAKRLELPSEAHNKFPLKAKADGLESHSRILLLSIV